MDFVARPFRGPIPNSDSDDRVEPTVFIRRGFEEWSDTKVILRRVNDIAIKMALKHILRTQTQPTISHSNQMSVVSFHSQPDVELSRIIWPPDEPIAAKYDPPLQPIAAESSTRNRHDPTVTKRRVTVFERTVRRFRRLYAKSHQVTCLDFRHGFPRANHRVAASGITFILVTYPAATKSHSTAAVLYRAKAAPYIWRHTVKYGTP